jgi:hypothetical protein
METCYFCNQVVPEIPDRVLRICNDKCKMLYVDCSPEYTRYGGSLPVEQLCDAAEEQRFLYKKLKDQIALQSSPAKLPAVPATEM